jgi:hypothetical protein
MLYHLFYFFRHDVTGINVVRYITFRTAVASLRRSSWSSSSAPG